eukprot:scaffold302505_cov19-Prasinocladus_malaysianus.AAC.1
MLPALLPCAKGVLAWEVAGLPSPRSRVHTGGHANRPDGRQHRGAALGHVCNIDRPLQRPINRHHIIT